MAKKRSTTRKATRRRRTPPDDLRRRRRRRILAGLQGRRLDVAYLNHQDIREDLEAEAADPDPDALLTPETLQHLQELIEQERRTIGAVVEPREARGVAAVAAAPIEPMARIVLD